MVFPSSDEQALKVLTHSESSTWRRSNRGRGRGRGKGRSSDSRSKGRGRDNHYSTNYDSKFDKFNIECYRCHGYGHYKSECNTNLNVDKGEKSNFAEKEEETLLMAYHDKDDASSN